MLLLIYVSVNINKQDMQQIFAFSVKMLHDVTW